MRLLVSEMAPGDVCYIPHTEYFRTSAKLMRLKGFQTNRLMGFRFDVAIFYKADLSECRYFNLKACQVDLMVCTTEEEYIEDDSYISA